MAFNVAAGIGVGINKRVAHTWLGGQMYNLTNIWVGLKKSVNRILVGNINFDKTKNEKVNAIVDKNSGSERYPEETLRRPNTPL